jgi:ATP-dependent helicase HrpB
LVLDQSTSKQVAPEESELLYRMVKSKLHRFAEGLPRWEARAKRAAAVDARIQIMSPEDLDLLLREACEGRRSFKEFSGAHIFDAIIASTQVSGRVHEVCPERITLPSGRTPSVEYKDGKPPFIESCLQDFCGLEESPKVAAEPLVMHLLAPNKRAVQVTTDLPSFWRVHYPSIRKELSRKYPRHAWPEDPSSPMPMKVRLPRG